jgi:hypothetical protein
MTRHAALERLATDIADLIEAVDADTEGQYGNGIGSESEERQLDLLVEALRESSNEYQAMELEVPYPAPDSSERYDLRLPDDTPVEAKLLRYWRANGDPEDYMYTHVFSPFHDNTLLTDAKRLHETDFDTPVGLLGLFYARAEDDPTTVRATPEMFTAEILAQKIVEDIEYWFDFEAEVCECAHFSGLRHSIHGRGAAITWALE